MTCLVSLISDHILPNYLFIKEMEGKYDSLLFVTTPKMKNAGIGKRLEKALGLEANSIRRIVVSEENLNEMLVTLESELPDKNELFIVNLTCGTKIMSIGVYEFFSKLTSSFYYIPIGKNKIENVRTSESIPIQYRITLSEYLTLYGLIFEISKQLYYPPEHTFNLFERFKKANFNRYSIPEIKDAGILEENDKRYYSGVWFEEYTYLRVKKEYGLSDDYISQGVKIYREHSGKFNDNEIDLMFVHNNKLYVVECKVSMYGVPPNGGFKLLEQYMYKLAAISKDFGLTVNSYIFTLHNFHKFTSQTMSAIEKRMIILGIKGILESDAFKKEKLNIE